MTTLIVTQAETGEVLREQGPYENAAAACRAAGEQAGQALTWERLEDTWQTEKGTPAYEVPNDAPDPVNMANR